MIVNWYQVAHVTITGRTRRKGWSPNLRSPKTRCAYFSRVFRVPYLAPGILQVRAVQPRTLRSLKVNRLYIKPLFSTGRTEK